jgi:hypothetical protein
MRLADPADQDGMAKPRKEPSGEAEAMTPEMHALIRRFDAKDRRDEEARKSGKNSEARRRRSDKPSEAA